MKRFILIVFLIVPVIFLIVRQHNRNYYDLINAVSGATPLAVARDVPGNITLTVNGYVKKPYTFSSSALNGFAHTRIRIKEFTKSGIFEGAYAYQGIPVFNILEGIAPVKPENTPFNQPVDMFVEFTSSGGQSILFSYNEIIMNDDHSPVLLAFHREPVMPTNEKVLETYDANLRMEPLDGLRLIVPAEPDTERFLDNVTEITLGAFDVDDTLLPKRQKKIKCSSLELTCIDNELAFIGEFEDVPRSGINKWTMVGHGHGFEKIVQVDGYHLPAFLEKNFDKIQGADFFLFVACDGYRCLFSSHEIFRTPAGRQMIIADQIDGNPTRRGFRLAPTDDFFADRSMWGLSHVVRITPGAN